MPNVATTEVKLTGDIGGEGICRLHWTNAGSTTPTSSECDSAGNAALTLFSSLAVMFPTAITWTVQQLFKVVDVATGALVAEVAASAPFAGVTGTAGGNYAAGIGGRGFWHTSTVRNRRFVRGATFFVPLNGGSFTSDGALAAGNASGIAASMTNYIADVEIGGLFPVVWSKPRGTPPAGGATAIITAGSCSQTPGGLRSRRS